MGIKYNMQMGPAYVPNLETAQKTGLNCAALAHLINEEVYGIKLPDDLGPVEWWLDSRYSRFLDQNEELRAGDVAFFGKSDTNPQLIPDSIKDDPLAVRAYIKRYPAHHLAVYIGQSVDYQPLFIHSSYAIGGVAIWMEDQFYNYRSSKGSTPYGILHGLKRTNSLRGG